MRAAFLFLPLIALSACHQREKSGDGGTSVSINAKDNDGSDVAIRADGDTGKVSVKIPGFEGKVTLPKVMLSSSNFEIDGVKLYPGSKVGSVNVNADKSGGKDESKVDIAFTSPADPAKVAAYLRSAFAERQVTFAGNDSSMTGKTSDGDDFIISLTPGAAGQTAGTVAIIAH